MATIHNLQERAFATATDKGFHDGRTLKGRDDTLLRLCLVHTEISEAAQEVKRHWPTERDAEPAPQQIAVFAEELADACIRIFDIAGCVGADLESAILEKMHKNALRPTNYGTAKEARGEATDASN